MFDLRVMSRRELDEGVPVMRGQITLDDFSEQFLSPLTTWTASDYEASWIASARRLAAGKPRVGFLTAVDVDEVIAFCWQAWRVGNDVVFQETMLLPDRLTEPLRRDLPDVHVGDRRTENADGEPVSEWLVSLVDIQAYVDRHRSSVPA